MGDYFNNSGDNGLGQKSRDRSRHDGYISKVEPTGFAVMSQETSQGRAQIFWSEQQENWSLPLLIRGEL